MKPHWSDLAIEVGLGSGTKSFMPCLIQYTEGTLLMTFVPNVIL